jgi:hypothetical protein
MRVTRRAPRCARCVNPDPAAWRRCPACADTWQLSRTPCARCNLDQRTRALLSGPADTIDPDLVPFHRVLLGVERPDAALRWLANATVQPILAELGGLTRPLAHDVLDALPASHTLDRASGMTTSQQRTRKMNIADNEAARMGTRWEHQDQTGPTSIGIRRH